jgi:hypothetical protein
MLLEPLDGEFILGRPEGAPRRRPASGRSLLSIAVILLVMLALAQPAWAASTQLDIDWEDDTPTDHDGFKIERKTGVSGSYTQIGLVEAAVRAYADRDPGLQADTTYCYRLRAYNAAGDSDYSNEICLVRFTLTVIKSGTGAGTITSTPAGIICGSACSHTLFPSATVVTLTATASTGSAFTGWSGGGCTGTASCTVTMSQARSVTATFASDPSAHTLTVSVGGSSGGSVGSNPSGIACPPVCAASFTHGAAVTLGATADADGDFREWRCTPAPCSGYLYGDKTVRAVFSRKFADAPLMPQATPIRAAHVTELRAAIDTLRSRVGWGRFAYPTDPIVTPQATSVTAAHLTEMCAALKQAYPAAACTTALASGQVIQAIHFTNLRNAVRAAE